MKHIIILIVVLIVVAVFGKKGFGYFTKYRNAKKLKVGIDTFKLDRINLVSLFSSVPLNLKLNVTNFSKSTFNVEQINVDVFSPSGQLIAEQTTPLKQGFDVLPNQNNLIPLSYLISPPLIDTLISESGGLSSVSANFLTTGQYGIPIHLKGFVTAEGFTINLDEKITV